MSILNYRPSVILVKAARLDHLYDPEHDEDARMGHYWWFWVPYYHNNGGSIRSGSACVDHNIKWLCFSLSLTFWRAAP